MTMRIDHMPSTYARRVSLVTLESEKEYALTDTALLKLCDNLQGVKFNKRSGCYELTGEPFGPPPPFGGAVERYGDKAKVSVFTD